MKDLEENSCDDNVGRDETKIEKKDLMVSKWLQMLVLKMLHIVNFLQWS